MTAESRRRAAGAAPSETRARRRVRIIGGEEVPASQAERDGDQTDHHGTSTSGPITAVKATAESIPKAPTATAIASSKLFDAAVNASEVVFS